MARAHPPPHPPIYIPHTFHICFLNMFHIFSFVCFLIYGVNRRQVLIAKPRIYVYVNKYTYCIYDIYIYIYIHIYYIKLVISPLYTTSIYINIYIYVYIYIYIYIHWLTPNPATALNKN